MATIEDKIQRILTRLENNTSLQSLVPGTVMHSLVESIAFEDMKIETSQELLEIKNSIALAGGIDLENIAKNIFGIKRRESIEPKITDTMKVLKFFTASSFGAINSGNDIIVQRGTLLEGATTNGSIKFVTTEEITLPSSANEMYISADFAMGTYDVIPANSIIKHNVTNYTDVSNNSLKITNVLTVATGRPSEGDDNFRYRINNALSSFVKTNYFGIHENLTGTPGVSDVEIFSADNGGGTMTIYINSVSPTITDPVIMDTREALYESIPPWVTYNVIAPTYKGIKLSINVKVTSMGSVSNQDNMKKQIIKTISSFVNNKNSTTFNIKEIENIVIGSDPNFENATITEASLYEGETFRAEEAIDLTDEYSYIINISGREKLIVEPISNAIIVSLT